MREAAPVRRLRTMAGPRPAAGDERDEDANAHGRQVLTALLAVGAGAGAAVAIRSTASTGRARRLWWLGAVAAAAAAAVVVSSDAPVPVGSALAGAGLVAAAAVDGVEGRVPTVVAYGTAVVAAGSLVAHALLSGDAGSALRAAALTGLLVAGCAALWLAGAMGFGDVRLATGTATAMLGGAIALVVVAWCGLLGAGLLAVRRRLVAPVGGGPRDPVEPRRQVPFAPPLAVAWLVAVVVV